MTAVSEQIGNWLEAFSEQDASPFQALRETGFHKFAELGFPTTHDEEWRFTNVAPIARGTFVPAIPVAPGDIDSLAPWTAGNRLVFVNGFLVEQVSTLPKGVSAGNLDNGAEPYLAQHAAIDHTPFVALNTAFLNQGAFVRIARGTVVEAPIHIVYVTLGARPLICSTFTRDR
jgi:Fe-S cluster assembly protein SufD